MKGGKSKSGAKFGDSKLAVKKSTKAAKDPNKPKRPLSAYFVFLDEFRKQFKEMHPNNKSVGDVAKAAGVKWKSMSHADKAPYAENAENRKKEYEKSMTAYSNKLIGEESDKSRSEVIDAATEGSGEEGQDEA